jgi:hypothetical protein
MLLLCAFSTAWSFSAAYCDNSNSKERLVGEVLLVSNTCMIIGKNRLGYSGNLKEGFLDNC